MRRLLLAAIGLLACNTGFDPQYRVLDLRILAVKDEVEGGSLGGMTVADVTTGDQLRLEALVANPLGRAPLDVRWYACAPPTAQDTSVPPCLDPDFLRDPNGLFGDPRFAGRAVLIGEGEVPPLVPVPDVSAALEEAISLAEAQPTYQCSLFAQVPIVVVAEADGRREVATKTIRVVPPPFAIPTGMEGAYVTNANPDVGDVLRAPADEDTCTGGTSVGPGTPFPLGKTTLCGSAVGGSSQTYNQCGAGGERTPTTEDLSWQWYVTAGTFPDFGGRGNATGGSVVFERPAEAFTLWGVLRDGRGGVAWTARAVAAAQ